MQKSFSCLGVIPVRLRSARLPGKPLRDITGKSLVRRVWERARNASLLQKLVIATEDQEIFEAGQQFGAEVVMTQRTHLTGSDRVGEVLEQCRARGERYDFVANIQGDMPFINPAVIDRAIEALIESPACGMSTVASPITDEGEFMRPSCVKVVLGEHERALYFSRAPIPYRRDEDFHAPEEGIFSYKHLGLYVFRADALQALKGLPHAFAETREKLEQLRALCGGIQIRCAVLPQSMVDPSIEVDTEDDLARAREYCAQKQI